MLTLSATPIPRTLNMALSGIRDMSTIEQPPFERQPIETYVLEYDDAIIAEAITCTIESKPLSSAPPRCKSWCRVRGSASPTAK